MACGKVAEAKYLGLASYSVSYIKGEVLCRDNTLKFLLDIECVCMVMEFMFNFTVFTVAGGI